MATRSTSGAGRGEAGSFDTAEGMLVSYGVRFHGNRIAAVGPAYVPLVVFDPKTGKGIRIRGGTARSYYVGIESSMPAVPGIEPPVHALCVAPFGMEEGTAAEIPPQEFGLVIGEQSHQQVAEAIRMFLDTHRL